MATHKWLYTVPSSFTDTENNVIKYWFTHQIGSMTTYIFLATNQYQWENNGEEASGVLLEKVQPIQHMEIFTPGEQAAWEKVCELWIQNT